PALVRPLGGEDPDARVEAVAKLGALATPDALRILEALNEERLYATPEGRVLVVDYDKAADAATGEPVELPEDAHSITVNNRLRRELERALAGLRLLSEESLVHPRAAQEVQQNAGPEQLPLLERARAGEADARIRDLLEMAVATIKLKSEDAARRKQAAERLADSTKPSIRPMLAAMAEPRPDGSF